MSKSTQQRWYADNQESNVYAEDGVVVCGRANTREDCRRIVSDHNACLGIESSETTVPELVAVCRRLIEEFSDASQYKGAYLREKHGDDDLLREAQAVLAKTGQP